MSIRLLPLVLTAALVLSLGAVVGCGGDDEDGNGDNGPATQLTLEEYFQEIEQIRADSEEEANAVEDRLDQESETLETADQAIDLFDEAITDFLVIAVGVGDDLDAIQPPSEVSSLHDDFVAAWNDGVDALESLQSDLDGVESEEDLLDLLPLIEEEFGSLGDTTEQICLDLQAVADEGNIDVDLGCEGDEE